MFVIAVQIPKGLQFYIRAIPLKSLDKKIIIGKNNGVIRKDTLKTTFCVILLASLLQTCKYANMK